MRIGPARHGHGRTARRQRHRRGPHTGGSRSADGGDASWCLYDDSRGAETPPSNCHRPPSAARETGTRDKGEGRREKGEGRREKGQGRNKCHLETESTLENSQRRE